MTWRASSSLSQIPEIPVNSPLISVFPKMRFSMVVPEVHAKLKERNTRSVVLFGIEAHVCVLQTALDLLEQGYDGAFRARTTHLAIFFLQFTWWRTAPRACACTTES